MPTKELEAMLENVDAITEGPNVHRWELDFGEDETPSLILSDKILEKIGLKTNSHPGVIHQYVMNHVVPKDKEVVQNAIRKMLSGETVEFIFKFETIETSLQAIKCYGTRIEDGKKPRIVGFFQNNNKVFVLRNRDSYTKTMLKSFSVDYDYVCYVHVGNTEQDDYVEEYKQSDFINKLTNNWEGKISILDRVNLIADKLVSHEDKNRLLKTMNRNYIASKVNASYVFSERFKIHYLHLVYTYEVTFLGDKDDNDQLVGAICGIRLLSEAPLDDGDKSKFDNAQDKAEREKIFDSLFIQDFEAAYLVDLSNKSFEVFNRSELTAGRNAIVPDFEVYVRSYIERDVYFEDRDKLIGLCDIANVRKALEGSNTFSVNYRDISTGVPLYYKMKIIDAGNDKIAVGIMKIQQEYIEETIQREKLEEEIRRQKNEIFEKESVINSLNKDMSELIVLTVESRHEDTIGHTRRMKELTYILSKQVMNDYPEYGLTEDMIIDMSEASNLHDVGKIAIPDNILYKPDKLTKEEFTIMKDHSEKGFELVSHFKKYWDDTFFDVVSSICRFHHERWNGEGYPQGLKGENIPLCAQIVGLTDVFDALVTRRVYKGPYSPKEAFKMINDGECGSFNPKLLESLKKCFSDMEAVILNNETPTESAKKRNLFSQEKFISSEDNALLALNRISRHMPGGFFIYQMSTGSILYFNDLLVKYFKCDTRDEFIRHINNSYRGIIHPDDYEEVKSIIDNQYSQNGKHVDHMKYRILCKDGSERYVDDYGHVVHTDKYGDICYVFLLDVTQSDVISTKKSDIKPSDLLIQNEQLAGKKLLNGVRILLVDDNDLSRYMTKDTLEDEGAVVSDYSSGEAALNAIKEVKPFDIILLDLVMPGMNGADLTREIRLYEQGKDYSSPIIAITGEKTSELATQAMNNGANGCMGKPLIISELARLLILSLKENSYFLQRKLENTIYIANVDALTHVKNMTAYTNKISELSLSLKKNPYHQFGAIICDINNLKVVNDSYGHGAGDEYIRNCARLICEAFCHSPVYRIGGDEFAVILEDVDYKNSKTLFQAFKNNVHLDAKINQYSQGIHCLAGGLAIYDYKIDSNVQDVIRRADAMMYEDKHIAKGLK